MDIQNLRNIRPLSGKNKKCTWFLAETPSGRTVFLKRYWGDGKTEIEREQEKAIREILTYENISLPFIPKHYGGSLEDGYIILEYLNLVDLEPTNKDIQESINIVLYEFPAVDCQFFPKKTFSLPIEKKIMTLRTEGYPNWPITTGLYHEIKEEIRQSSTYFCHGDYLLQNIKRREDGKLVTFDFELANRNHLLNDLAILFIDLVYLPEMQKFLFEYLSGFKNFDKDIFDVLVWRRAVEQVYALRNMRKIIRPFKTGVETLKKFN